MDINVKFKLPSWDEIPNLDLYLDQVISLVDNYLSPILPVENSEAILTKSMVNNYVKHKVIEAPVKKKYNKNSVCCLIAVCILKSVFSMNDISILLKTGLDIGNPEDTYRKFCNAIEKAVKCAFEGTAYAEPASTNAEPYLLQNIAQAFACKLYTQQYCLLQANASPDLLVVD